ncbi:hypothetical protein SEVIR_6G130706v4 [Setaria viridis]
MGAFLQEARHRATPAGQLLQHQGRPHQGQAAVGLRQGPPQGEAGVRRVQGAHQRPSRLHPPPLRRLQRPRGHEDAQAPPRDRRRPRRAAQGQEGHVDGRRHALAGHLGRVGPRPRQGQPRRHPAGIFYIALIFYYIFFSFSVAPDHSGCMAGDAEAAVAGPSVRDARRGAADRLQRRGHPAADAGIHVPREAPRVRPQQEGRRHERPGAVLRRDVQRALHPQLRLRPLHQQRAGDPRGHVLRHGPRRRAHRLHPVPTAVRGHRPLRPLRKQQHRLLRRQHARPRRPAGPHVRRHRVHVPPLRALRLRPAAHRRVHRLALQEEEGVVVVVVVVQGPGDDGGGHAVAQARGLRCRAHVDAGAPEVRQLVGADGVHPGGRVPGAAARRPPGRAARPSPRRAHRAAPAAGPADGGGGRVRHLLLVRGQDGVGRPRRVDLRVRHRGRGERLPHAQPRVALRLLHPQARRVPGHGAHQPHRPPPPGAPLGDRVRRDLLLPEQRVPGVQEAHVPAACRLPQRRHLPLHLHLPARVLLHPGAVALLGLLHRADAQRGVPLLPAHHHRHAHRARRARGQVVGHRARGLVAQRAVLAHLRDQRAPLRGGAGPAQGHGRDRDLLHAHGQGGGRRERGHLRRPLRRQVVVAAHPAHHYRHDQHHRHRLRLRAHRLQRQPALGKVHRRRLLQLLGARAPLPVRQGPHGTPRQDANHRLRLVGAHLHHHLPAVGRHQPAGGHSRRTRRRIPVPVIDSSPVFFF